MITLFNRQELYVTFDIQKKSKICSLLDAKGIDYDVKVKDISNPSPMMAGSRSRTGSFGVNFSSTYEYKIYVKKADIAEAELTIKEQIFDVKCYKMSEGNKDTKGV